jgi:hypothetical protein
VALLGFLWVTWNDFGVSRRDELCELVVGLDGDPLSALKVMRRLQSLVDEELLSQVGRARHRGVTWAEIGEVLGVTTQAVHKRFAGLV